MNIDIFTVFCQIINLTVLMIVIKKFFVSKIRDAVDQRNKRIKEISEKNAALVRSLDERQAVIDKKEKELSEFAESVLHKAACEAERLKEKLILEARNEVETLKSKWTEQALEEINNKEEKIREIFIKEVSRTASMAVEWLSGRDIHYIAILRLSEIIASDEYDEKMKMLMSDSKVEVISAVELNELSRKTILNAFAKKAGFDINISFYVDKNLICGIEMTGGGYRISWTIKSYLKNYLTKIEQAIKDEKYVN